MNMTTTPAFTEFQAGITEALAELDKLRTYCSDTLATAPDGALGTVQDLEGQIQDAADLIHAHLTIFKRKASKGRTA